MKQTTLRKFCRLLLTLSISLSLFVLTSSAQSPRPPSASPTPHAESQTEELPSLHALSHTLQPHSTPHPESTLPQSPPVQSSSTQPDLQVAVNESSIARKSDATPVPSEEPSHEKPTNREHAHPPENNSPTPPTPPPTPNVPLFQEGMPTGGASSSNSSTPPPAATPNVPTFQTEGEAINRDPSLPSGAASPPVIPTSPTSAPPASSSTTAPSSLIPAVVQQPGAPSPAITGAAPPRKPLSPVLKEEKTEGYQLFPLEKLEEERIFPAICAPRPGYGPSEQILFPPTSGFRDVWALLYLNKHGEVTFAFPMSESIWGTGDWFRLRHTLVEEGVNIIGSYGCDMQGNVAGGMSQGFAYADSIDFRLDLDMQKLVGWKGAHLLFSGLDRNGRNLSQKNIGNQFTVAQIWGVETINYYALWLDQSLFNGWANIKLGRVAATDDFSSNAIIYGLYLNNAIDGQPQLIPVSGFLSTYPASVWGARLRLNDLKHNLYGMFGIYQTSNRLYKASTHGLDFSIRKQDGMNFVWEAGWTPEFHPHPLPKTTERDGKKIVAPHKRTKDWKGMPGQYKLGVFYTPWRDIRQYIPTKNTFYSYGFYCLFDQMVYQAVPGTNKGLTLWTVFCCAPEQNTSKLVFQASGGAIYTGLIPKRSYDQMVLGIFYGTFSKDYAGVQQAAGKGYPTYELVLEAGYRINLAPFFYIQPDIQYVVRPGGTGLIQNAFVIGAQVGFSF